MQKLLYNVVIECKSLRNGSNREKELLEKVVTKGKILTRGRNGIQKLLNNILMELKKS